MRYQAPSTVIGGGGELISVGGCQGRAVGDDGQAAKGIEYTSSIDILNREPFHRSVYHAGIFK